MLFKRKMNTNSTDEELMQMVRKNNREAFSMLYDRYSDKLLKFFYYRLNCDADLANDFLQDLFLKIVGKPQLFDLSKSFSAWIYSIAINMIRNEYNKQSVRSNLMNLYLRDSESSITINSETEDFLQNLEAELELMKPIDKEIFKLRYSDELSIREIAEIVNIAEGTVKSKIFYIQKKLSEKLYMFDPKY